ncbi:MAG: GtrA family protein [Acidimicrobiales bacterium]
MPDPRGASPPSPPQTPNPAEVAPNPIPPKPTLARQVFRFAVIGGSNVLIDFGVYNLLLVVAPSRSPDTLVAYNTVAVICAICNSYFWNRAWTFRHQLEPGRGGGRWRERALFVVQGVLNVMVNDLVLAGVTVVLNRNHLLSAYLANNLAKIIGVMTASSVSFVAMRSVVFRAPGTRRLRRPRPPV